MPLVIGVLVLWAIGGAAIAVNLWRIAERISASHSTMPLAFRYLGTAPPRFFQAAGFAMVTLSLIVLAWLAFQAR